MATDSALPFDIRLMNGVASLLFVLVRWACWRRRCCGCRARLG